MAHTTTEGAPDAAPVTGGRWEQRPRSAFLVRVITFALPVIGSVATGYLLTAILPAPETTTWGIIRWLVVVAISTLMLVAVERVARRLIPLTVLFKLTLAFPDEVPSRLRLAMRVGTTTQLARRIAQTSTGATDETPGEAAHRLLELVTLLSRHDSLTRGHSERVRAYAHVIGTEMGVEGHELEQLRWSALLHDVGKIRVPKEILNKPGRLTDEEFDVIKSHPMAGKECVEPLAQWLGESVRAVWEHHERFDGGGYPQGLSGNEIARASRIVCVADAFDVMTSARSYKQPMSSVDARAELNKHAGTQFDPAVVRAFMSASIGTKARRSRYAAPLSHLALLPRAVVTQLGSVATIGAAVVAGSVGGSVGIAAAQRPEPPVIESTASTPSVTDDAGRDQGPDRTQRSDATETPQGVGERGTSVPAPMNERPPADLDPATSPVGPTAISAAFPSGTTTVGSTPRDDPDSVTPTTTVQRATSDASTTTAPRTTSAPTTTTAAPSTPNTTGPPVTPSPTTVPNVTMPNLTVPNLTVPNVSVPTVSVPEVVPGSTIPAVVPPVVVPTVVPPSLPVDTLPNVQSPLSPPPSPILQLPGFGR